MGVLDSGIGELQARKSGAETELKSLGVAISHTESDIVRLRKDIAKLGETIWEFRGLYIYSWELR